MDQDNNFYLISLGILICPLLDNVWNNVTDFQNLKLWANTDKDGANLFYFKGRFGNGGGGELVMGQDLHNQEEIMGHCFLLP